ncbi:aldehyde dehydrogenase [Brachybacterium sp. ACRRE]|uniref:aldehyde dehydrogenase family protein n=1 Tax=Brachybacterium sp. ACRRE TaxID=2918184 RepID=UPI001EF17753|nr:aldehyde dehydrogenase family protein [Brachybacterium sp. ACRRE]MCG7310728.1 aldehyde dehydrogenase family protein [Brachybacterium sp. ACRRE]
MSTVVDHWIDGTTVLGRDHHDIRGTVDNSVHVRVAVGSAKEVALATEAASRAAADWRWLDGPTRGRILRAIADRIREQSEELAAIEIADTGKTPATAAAEIEISAQYFEFYGTLVNLPVGDVLDVARDQHVYTKREPFGVVGVITPWNLPLNQAARAIAPALATGNTLVCKPAEVTSQSTVRLAQIAEGCGLPSGVLNVVCGSGSVVGEAIVRDPRVRKVAFTGSVGVGRAIGQIAADRLIPLTLELGGKSACIVFDDADLDRAAEEAVRAFVGNAGQVCSSGTRLLVQDTIHDRFVERVSELVREKSPGRDYGPMITWPQFRTVQGYLTEAHQSGLTPSVGGRIENRDPSSGAYVPATVYPDVAPDNKLVREEIFGPVLVTTPFSGEDEALRLANDSDFGLVGAVFTQDISRAFRVAERIEAGQIGVNTWVTGAVETPFGGCKASGYGREKGIEALHHYSQMKSVIMRL